MRLPTLVVTCLIIAAVALNIVASLLEYQSGHSMSLLPKGAAVWN